MVCNIASCPFTVCLQEKLGCILIHNPFFRSVSVQLAPLLTFSSPGQMNLISFASPHVTCALSEPDRYQGLLLDPLQYVSIQLGVYVSQN